MRYRRDLPAPPAKRRLRQCRRQRIRQHPMPSHTPNSASNSAAPTRSRTWARFGRRPGSAIPRSSMDCGPIAHVYQRTWPPWRSRMRLVAGPIANAAVAARLCAAARGGGRQVPARNATTAGGSRAAERCGIVARMSATLVPAIAAGHRMACDRRHRRARLRLLPALPGDRAAAVGIACDGGRTPGSCAAAAAAIALFTPHVVRLRRARGGAAQSAATVDRAVDASR